MLHGARGLRGAYAGAAFAVAAFAVASWLATPAARAEPAPYDIPVVTSLTGSGAFLGLEEKIALQLAETSFNASGGIHGRPVHFLYLDDQSSPQTAVQLTSQVVAAHPTVLIGSTSVANCNAMQPFVKNGPVMICMSAGVHPAAGSYMFASGISTYDYIATLLRYFRLRGWTRLALMTSSDATGQDADRAIDALTARPENKDIEVVARVHFDPGDISVVAQLERVKQAAPQAFIAWATGSPSATIFRDAKQAGLNVPVGTTAGNMTYAQMYNFAAILPEQLYLSASEWPVSVDPAVPLQPAVAEKQRALIEAYRKAGEKLDEGGVLAWDPATLVVDALRALPDGASAAQLRDYLVQSKGQAGISGVYDFVATPQRGLSLDDVVITRWNKAADRWMIVSKPMGEPLP